MKRILFCLLAILVAFVLITPVHATLITRGIGTSTHGNHRLIYDTDLDITWYDFTVTELTWNAGESWADTLAVTFGTTGYDDWRLPTTPDDNITGYNLTNSEMGHLYYTELGKSAFDGLSSGTGDFQNLTEGVYWSGTIQTTSPTRAYWFGFSDGRTLTQLQSWTSGMRGMAVRDGDVAAVPEPATIALLGIGLAGLAGAEVRRRRKKKSVDNH